MIPDRPTSQHCLIILFTVFLFSCDEKNGLKPGSSKTGFFTNSKINIEDVSKKLKSNIDALKSDSSTSQQTILLKQAYQNSNFQPYWLAKGGVEDFVFDYLKQLDSLQFDGLNPQKFCGDSLLKIATGIESKKITSVNDIALFDQSITKSFLESTHDVLMGRDFEILPNKDWKNKNDTAFDAVSFLKETIVKNNFASVFGSLRPNHVWYKKFSAEYKKLCKLSVDGGWTTIKDLEDSVDIGFQSKYISALRIRLHKETGEPNDTISDTWSEDLANSIKKYQFQHQLKSTGMIDSATLHVLNKGLGEKLKTLALNMERMRWMKKDFPQPYIWVDVPKMELDYVERDSVKFNMRVVVGRKSRPTPSLDSRIENIVLSPPWTVPPTIMKEEILPGLARRGGGFLARRGLKAYRGGRLVNPSMINAKNYKMFAISQAPGYRSSLGEVKFNMINPWAIYLHDTPHREDFVKSFRAYSSGCIRVHKPKQFAEFLLQDTLNYSYAKIDSICKKRTTIYLPFKRNVDVHIVYLTNALDSLGNVMYLKDVYGWDG
jgi:L,D-transpeptidase YcbB